MSGGMNTANTEALIRAELWSNQLKDTLKDSLEAQKYVNWLGDFNDGEVFTIPSIGDMDAQDYAEDTAVDYTAMDTGEFQFSITEYLQSGTYITNKQKQDSMYSAMLQASFVPKQERAILTRLELDVMKCGQPGTPGGQTAGSLNPINGADHRWVGSNLINANQTLAPKDFARAKYALKKALVPQTNLIAIVDPSVEYVIETMTNLVDVSNNPRWEGIIETGMATGMKFLRNVYGFDVYTCNYLHELTAAETIDGTVAAAGSVANLFFSAAPDIKPFVGKWRQLPKVDGEYNKDRQREEFVTTARYGVKLYRPENLVTVLAHPDVIV